MIAATVAAVSPISGDVDLAAEDELHAMSFRGIVEIDGTVEVAMVGNCNRVHPKRENAGEEVLHPDGTVHDAVLGVQV